MSKSRLEAAPSTMANGMGRMIVIRSGYDVWHYGNPYEAKTWWASCGRAFMTMMFGEMIMEGAIAGGAEAVEKPVNAIHCTEARAFRDDILLKHLLSYTSCADPPGSGYKYHCNYFSMYRIVEQLDGRRPGIRLLELGNKIGADWEENLWWGHNDPGGSPFLSVRSTEADAARWGYLWMNKGNWKGRTIVPEWYVNRSLEPMPSPNGGYADKNEGWQIHTNWGGGYGDIIPRDAFWKTGGGKRLIFACPSLRLVFAQSIDAGYTVQATAEAIIKCIVDPSAAVPSRNSNAAEATSRQE